MSLVTPIGKQQVAFDAHNDSVFYFIANGGDQVVKNKIIIRNNETNVIVYTNTVETYLLQQTVPANTLLNQHTYKFSFITYNASDERSIESEPIMFRCYETPVITISGIPSDNIVKNATNTFQFTYGQTNELLDNIVFKLYDINGVLVDTSKNFYSSDEPPITFDYTVSGLEDGKNYYLNAEALTVWGRVVKSPNFPFKVSYTKKDIYSSITVENLCNEGYVQIDTNLLAVKGIAFPTPPKYIPYSDDDIALDLSRPNSWVKWNEGFSINNDFEIRLWFKPTFLGDIAKFYRETPIVIDGLSVELGRTMLDTYTTKSYSPNNFNEYVDTTKKYVIVLNKTDSGTISVYNETTDRIYPIFIESENEMGKKYVEVPIDILGNGIYRITFNVPFDVNIYEIKDYFEIYDESKEFTMRSNYIKPINNLAELFIGIKKLNNQWTLIYQNHNETQNSAIWSEESNDWQGFSNIEYNKITNVFYDYEGSNITHYVDSITTVDTPFESVKLSNGEYDHFNVMANPTNEPISDTKPTIWEDNFVLNTNFENTIDAGSLAEVLDTIESIKIKRRKYGDIQWITLKTISIQTLEDFDVSLKDYFTPSNNEFQYAIVPVLNGGIEGTYIISQYNKTQFNGLFITDGILTFKLYNGLVYNTNDKVYHTGLLEPIGGMYPVIVDNSKNNYNMLSIQGNILGYDFERTRRINRGDVVDETNDFINFLLNKKPKFVKDWNGNIYLGRVINNINQNTDLTNGYNIITFNFVEQGKYNNYDDLNNNGFINIYDNL